MIVISKRKIKAYYRNNEVKLALLLGAVMYIGLMAIAFYFPNGL